MSTRSRIAITVATTLLLGAWDYARDYAFEMPSISDGVWHGGDALAIGLAIVSVFCVYRWWALLPAIAPIAVSVYIHTVTDYAPPRPQESIDLSSHPESLVALSILVVLIFAAILSVGLLLRAAWEWVRSTRDQGNHPTQSAE